jgi:hypothetical protein
VEKSEEMKAGFPSQPRAPAAPASGLRGCSVCHTVTKWRGRASPGLAGGLDCAGRGRGCAPAGLPHR